jgi:hypothetical protein
MDSASSTVDEGGDDDDHPDAFVCPITLELMEDPVFTADGQTYDRASITQWFKSNKTSPMTGLELPHTTLLDNLAMMTVIQQYRATKGLPPAKPSYPLYDASTGQPLSRFDAETGKPLA